MRQLIKRVYSPDSIVPAVKITIPGFELYDFALCVLHRDPTSDYTEYSVVEMSCGVNIGPVRYTKHHAIQSATDTLHKHGHLDFLLRCSRWQTKLGVANV